MAKHEYGKLENRMIDLFHDGAPDFAAAEQLIQQGADVNATSADDEEEENVLSAILEGYWISRDGGDTPDACRDCEDDDCNKCEHNLDLNPNLGASMCAIIRFFLSHGFDVTRRDGRAGAECLEALTLSTFDRYIIEATKILLDAGAKNRSLSAGGSYDDGHTPQARIGQEGDYESTCRQNYALANIYEAAYQVYEAVEDGRPYSGIDSFELAIGKTIQKVMARGEEPFFFAQDLPEFQKEKCFTSDLYFVYHGGALITTQYADVWTDTFLPDTGMVDISAHFEEVIGDKIAKISFGYNEIKEAAVSYTQPITIIEMESGRRIRFSVNFGEVSEENQAAYFELDV